MIMSYYSKSGASVEWIHTYDSIIMTTVRNSECKLG